MADPHRSARAQRLKPLKEALATYRPVLTAAVVFSLAINILLFVTPLYMMQIYDRVLSSRSEPTLVMISVIAVMAMVIYGLLEYVRSRMLVRVGMQFDEVLSGPLFDAAISTEINSPQGQSVQAVRDMDSVREFLTGGGLITLCDAPWAPLFIALGFFLHPLLGTVALVGAIVIFGLALINEMMTRQHLRNAGDAANAAAQYVSATLRNKEVIHAMGMRGAVRDRWLSQHRGVIGWQASASDRAGGLHTLTKFMRMALQTAILGAGAWLAIRQEISPGAMIAASMLMGRALQPVEQAVGQWKGFVAARDAYGRLSNLFLATPTKTEAMALPSPKGAVSAESAFVAPPGAPKATLRNVSFAVAPGEVLAIIGPSGSGKTTLLRALVGVWPTISGAIRIDGSALPHWDSEQLGKHLGYLPQDVELFAGSIAENIARFSEADPVKVVQAAELAGVHQLIQSLPQGYDTVMGAGGGTLSGGQRQRVGLARALYNMPAVVVLDEPNSNLDSSGEDALAAAIRAIKQAGSTVIVSTHKRNLLANADKVLVLQDGSVQAFGPRDQVLQKFTGPRAVPSPGTQPQPIPAPNPAATPQSASA
ncbi:type I secretion system permease/ATPase [Devosia sp. 1566]|uniref:type I secretion system permease/ATPase n=1 Tax=Devosia sp. 1566 TaxID=2499144 RepID=UPI000FDBF0B0|nr:type I secretion system permease/ATPase [Devosia sp. 1566]